MKRSVTPYAGRALACLLLLFSASAVAQAAVPATQTFCVWDLLGEQGDAATLMKDYALAARNWGANIKLKVYTNEGVAADDFKAGQCDGVLMTGLRGRQFNAFTGSIDSVGSIPSYPLMHDVINLLSRHNAKLEPYFLTDSATNKQEYEMVGVVPAGAAYAFVDDRSISSLDKAAGKKIAVLDWDKSQAEMVKIVGAVPVAADLTTYAGKFNNGQVDILFAPITMYRPMELYKGLGTKGGIARFPVIQITMQMFIHRDRFPAGFGQKSRDYMAEQAPRFFDLISNTEREVDPRHWMHVNVSYRSGYGQIMREMRIHLTKSGFYDPTMMKILKGIRCRREPDNAECSQNDEGGPATGSAPRAATPKSPTP